MPLTACLGRRRANSSVPLRNPARSKSRLRTSSIANLAQRFSAVSRWLRVWVAGGSTIPGVPSLGLPPVTCPFDCRTLLRMVGESGIGIAESCMHSYRQRRASATLTAWRNHQVPYCSE